MKLIIWFFYQSKYTIDTKIYISLSSKRLTNMIYRQYRSRISLANLLTAADIAYDG